MDPATESDASRKADTTHEHNNYGQELDLESTVESSTKTPTPGVSLPPQQRLRPGYSTSRQSY
jgi:hypothetical protein